MAKRVQKKKSPVSIPVILALILLCLTLVSIHFSSGIVARYVTTAESDDSARVIKFEELKLEVTGVGTQYIIPGVALEWNAKVTFEGSESATYVFLEVTGVADGANGTVTPCENAPDWLFWTVDTESGTDETGKWTYLGAYTVKRGDDEVPAWVYYRALAPNTELTGVPLFKSAEISADNTVTLTADTIAKITAATPAFRASVVQSNGFDSPEAAWQSLETKHGD